MKKLQPAHILTMLIAALATATSSGGLLIQDIYRDNAFVKTTWFGNDLVTLILAVPILVIAMVFSLRGSLKARLIWFGALDYMLYNYAFYLFGTTFNVFFLLYTALFGLSIFALIFGLANLDLTEVQEKFHVKTPVKWIASYFLFVAFGLGFVYLMQSIRFISTGQLPSIVTMSGHPTNVVFALDLTLLVPWLVLAGIWLFKQKPWGYVIAGILSVKGPLYTLILAINSVLVFNAGLTNTSDVPLWGTLTLLGLLAAGLLFGNMKS